MEPERPTALERDNELSRRRRLLVLAICSMSLLIVGLDTTIVNVALPAIHNSLHASLSGLQSFQEVGDLVYERVFVADLQSRHPPFFHVGVIASMIGDVDRLPGSQSAFVAVVEILKPVQVVQVPLE